MPALSCLSVDRSRRETIPGISGFIQRAANTQPRSGHHLRIDLRGRNIVVPQQLLHRADMFRTSWLDRMLSSARKSRHTGSLRARGLSGLCLSVGLIRSSLPQSVELCGPDSPRPRRLLRLKAKRMTILTNFSLEPPAAALSVFCRCGSSAAPRLRRRAVSSGCGSVPC